MFKSAYPVMGLGLWQGRGIIGESRAFNNPGPALNYLRPLSTVMPSLFSGSLRPGAAQKRPDISEY